MPWLAATLGFAALIWLWRMGTEPFANPISDGASLARALRLLLNRGVHADGIRGTLTISLARASAQRLVYAKYIEAQMVGFRATVPNELWVQAYLPALKAELDRRGIPFRTGEEPAALTIELKTDCGGAYMIARLLFEDTLGHRIARDCVATFRNVMNVNAPRFTGVDEPDDGWA